MKRAVFVTAGTIAGLTATLRYTPDNSLATLGSTMALGSPQTNAGSGQQGVTTNVPSAVPSATATKTVATPTPTSTAKATPTPTPTKATPAPTSTAKATPTPTPAKPTPTPTPTKATPTPTPVKPTPTPTPTKATPTPTPAAPATFTGNSAQALFYGNVQVSITVTNRKITAITPLQWPQGGLSTNISGYAIPYLIQEALTAQSAKVASISGASYTSAAFKSSLASAIAKAGL